MRQINGPGILSTTLQMGTRNLKMRVVDNFLIISSPQRPPASINVVPFNCFANSRMSLLPSQIAFPCMPISMMRVAGLMIQNAICRQIETRVNNSGNWRGHSRHSINYFGLLPFSMQSTENPLCNCWPSISPFRHFLYSHTN